MSESKKTPGGTWVNINENKKGTTNINVYDQDPKGKHKESIHISIREDGKGRISTKTGDEKRKETDISCFLTTACMRYYHENFNDDCYELRMLRWLRDNCVLDEDVAHYYDVAPTIVERIGKDNQDIVYNYIYDNLICYGIIEIENGNYGEAVNRYKQIVDELERFYLPDSSKKVLKLS